MSSFDEIGEAGILAVLTDLYTQLFDDPMVGFLFQGHDKSRLVALQAVFTRRFLGDPSAVYAGKSVPDAHAALPILPGHFDRRHHLLAQTLAAHDVPARVREHWLSVDSGLRSSVLKVGRTRVEELSRTSTEEPPDE